MSQTKCARSCCVIIRHQCHSDLVMMAVSHWYRGIKLSGDLVGSMRYLSQEDGDTELQSNLYYP